MFLGIQGFNFCPNLIKSYLIYPKLPKFYSNFTQILPKFS